MSRLEGGREKRGQGWGHHAASERAAPKWIEPTDEGGRGDKHYANRCTVPHVVGYSAQVDRREEGCTYYVNCRVRIAGP